ncbi:MAG: hypothetical protein H5U24_13705 [Thioclava marina]|nr:MULTISPECIES: DUF6455 family protein [Thioclava]MBC7146439.1 hypothetical protein [Thioclava marina]MBD3803352.1 hypothetical protein [Thioclava sp.]TNE92335.1 MAG: hypothetical protein EP337_05560 [Paracoccaceae bacterium]TNF13052.1 MAG: hypothetical protein EP320_10145 [Paracoccaceae bacterium]
MGMQNSIDLNFWLTRGMARRIGVNISEAMHDGFLTQADFAQMITTCRTCGRTELCLAILAEKGADPEPIPEDCPNSAILNSLRALH